MQDASSRWIERTTLSALLRAVVFFGPLAASFGFAWLATRSTSTPSTTSMVVFRWVVIAALSTVVLTLVERQLRRLMPLVALLRLSLSFPDRAPSRVRLALRSSSEAHLEQRIADARNGDLGDTAGEAAVRILELVAALNLHDSLTKGHSERVRAYSRMVGKELGLDDRELDRLMWAALLHDIGKLLVPTEILNKSGKLTDDEFDVIKQHPEYGKSLVAPLTPWLGDASRAVWEHHERWSGGGYPRGIEGTDISLPARIVSVADTFDVITSVRSYKVRSSPKEARVELARCAGTQFDPAVVHAFMNASIHRYAWMSTPAAWLAQTTFLPPAAISALVRGGLVASGVTVGGLAIASGVSADDVGNRPAQSTSVRRVDDVELLFVDEDSDAPIATLEASADGEAPTETTPDAIDRDDEPDSSTDQPTTTVDSSTPSTTDSTGPTNTSPTTTEPGVTPPPITTPATTDPPSTVSPPTVPPPTVPSVTVPSVTVPSVSVPPVTVPVIELPDVSIPPVTVPVIDGPTVTVPVIEPPDVSVPPITVPITTPPITTPPISIPPITLPDILGG